MKKLEDFTQCKLYGEQDVKTKGGVWKLERTCTCDPDGGTLNLYREYKFFGLVGTNNYYSESD